MMRAFLAVVALAVIAVGTWWLMIHGGQQATP